MWTLEANWQVTMTSMRSPTEMPVRRTTAKGFLWCCQQLAQPIQTRQVVTNSGMQSADSSLCPRFNGHIPGEPGLASVYWSKGWWRWWWQLDYWSYKSCKTPVKSSPTNQHPVFRLDALALSVIATATWLGGWLAGWLSHSGIVSKPLNLSENFFDHLKAPSL